jgi:rare lipoprotein A
MRLLTLLTIGLGASVLLGACASPPPASRPPRDPPPAATDAFPSGTVPPDVQAVPDAVPREEALLSGPNKPYTVLGQSYTPDTSAKPLKQRGQASWYGKKFHGNRTASGEIYDMFAMTAAHRTLPIPSYARVTLVSTGKSVVVRVNDRGPFSQERVIDLSYTAAAKLGIVSRGTAEVLVERVFAGDSAAASR